MTALLNMNDVTGGAEVVLMSATLCKDLYRLDPLSDKALACACVCGASASKRLCDNVVTVMPQQPRRSVRCETPEPPKHTVGSET